MDFRICNNDNNYAIANFKKELQRFAKDYDLTIEEAKEFLINYACYEAQKQLQTAANE